MKSFIIFGGLGVMILSACSPRPSPELDAEINSLREQISELESLETEQVPEIKEVQDQYSSSIETLEKEKKQLQDSISSLETEIANSANDLERLFSQSGNDQKMDHITLLNGNTLSAEIQEISGEHVKILVDGEEKTGALSTIEAIHFRSGKEQNM